MKRKYLLLIVLFIIMLLITFGYAYLSAGLNISGSSTIHNATWSIYWDNVQVTTGSVSASTPVIDTAKTTVSYNIILEKPGDFYEFTVDVKNDGTIDAMIESISSKLNGVVIQTLPSYLIYSVTYADDVEIQNNQLLSANSSDTYKVRIEYKRDITISDMPTTQQNLSLSFSVNYIQANNNATRVRDILFETSSRVFTIGESVPSNVQTYTNYQDAVDAFGHNFFLRHTVANNIVVNTDIGFVMNNTLYYMKGGGCTYNPQTDNCNNDSIYYEENKQTLKTAFGASYCNEIINTDRIYYCSKSGYLATVADYGRVMIHDNTYTCDLELDFSSYCYPN